MKRILVFMNICVISACGLFANGENPLSVIKETPGLCSIFHSWGFIGDSLSSGEHEFTKEDGTTGYVDLYDYAWGTLMCKSMGADCDIYAQGGETAEGWIKYFWDEPKNGNNNIDAKASPKQAYIIALGVNDSGMGKPAGDIRTDIDTLDFKNNAATFAGCYAGIIQRIKDIAPDAKIFTVTIPRHSYTNKDFNDIIRSMPDVFKNVYVIDLNRYAPDYDTDIKDMYFMGGHMTAAGYQWTAWLMMTYIDYIIRSNPADFKKAAFINTPYMD